jgi:hypothetical protein
MEYLKAKIDELETKRKIKNITGLYRGINDFKNGYQPRTNIVKNKGGGIGYSFQRYFGWAEEIFLSAIECAWG